MKSLFALLLSVFFLLPPAPTQSQILRNIARRVQEKVAKQLEEKISERIAEEITKATMRQFDSFLDSTLQSEYESQRDSGNFTGTFEEFVLQSNLYAMVDDTKFTKTGRTKRLHGYHASERGLLAGNHAHHP